MKNDKLNDHTDKIACQTCHILHFARGDYASKTWWDRSTAGTLDNKEKPFAKFDSQDHEIYNSKKRDLSGNKT